MSAMDEEAEGRRQEEWEALLAVYGEEAVTAQNVCCWQMDIFPTSELSTPSSSSTNTTIQMSLEMTLPNTYPMTSPPVPKVRATFLNNSQREALEQELLELWSEDSEVAIMWIEHCRGVMMEEVDRQAITADSETNNNHTHSQSAGPDALASAATSIQTFYPPTSKYGQSIRHFNIDVIQNDANRRTIHRGEPFHPPKSGASEILVAHVASVTCMEHVHWVFAQLLFHDKKVAKATHNMMAYKFLSSSDEHGGGDGNTTKKGVVVSDNDDDGEKGAGSKLAALLDLSGAENVMVVVSRWFGGVLLGPARFKWIASTARDALNEFGFI